jgi:hypothetical protein
MLKKGDRVPVSRARYAETRKARCEEAALFRPRRLSGAQTARTAEVRFECGSRHYLHLYFDPIAFTIAKLIN